MFKLIKILMKIKQQKKQQKKQQTEQQTDQQNTPQNTQIIENTSDLRWAKLYTPDFIFNINHDQHLDTCYSDISEYKLTGNRAKLKDFFLSMFNDHNWVCNSVDVKTEFVNAIITNFNNYCADKTTEILNCTINFNDKTNYTVYTNETTGNKIISFDNISIKENGITAIEYEQSYDIFDNHYLIYSNSNAFIKNMKDTIVISTYNEYVKKYPMVFNKLETKFNSFIDSHVIPTDSDNFNENDFRSLYCSRNEFAHLLVCSLLYSDNTFNYELMCNRNEFSKHLVNLSAISQELPYKVTIHHSGITSNLMIDRQELKYFLDLM